MPLHITLYISVFSGVSIALSFFLVVIIMGKQQKWQFKREKHLSTWLNTQMSFRTWLPCVHTRLSGHTLSISYSNLLYMGKYVPPNEGREDLAYARAWERAFDSYPCFITSDSDMKPQQHLFSLSFILTHSFIGSYVSMCNRAKATNAVWVNATHDVKHLLHHSILQVRTKLNPLKTGNWH